MMLEIEQVNIWTKKIEDLQSQGKYSETADLVNKILSEINSYEYRFENDTEWIYVILNEKTLEILNT
jgi:hypothetical protein